MSKKLLLFLVEGDMSLQVVFLVTNHLNLFLKKLNMKLENQSDFYLLYKPNSWTSQDLCTFFKKKYKFQKVGHSGTLDPSAEG